MPLDVEEEWQKGKVQILQEEGVVHHHAEKEKLQLYGDEGFWEVGQFVLLLEGQNFLVGCFSSVLWIEFVKEDFFLLLLLFVKWND